MRPAPSLDHWTSAFLLAGFLAVFLAPLLYRQAGQRREQVGYISALLLLFGLMLGYYVLYWSGYVRVGPWPYVVGLPELSNFLYGPLCYLYLRELTGQPGRRRWRHFALAGAMLLVALPYLTLSPDAKRAAMRAGFHGGAGWWPWFFRGSR